MLDLRHMPGPLHDLGVPVVNFSPSKDQQIPLLRRIAGQQMSSPLRSDEE